VPLISIPLIDQGLCLLFGRRSRWFQLHSAINAIVVSIIYKDVIDLFIDPIANNRLVDTKIDCYYIIFLHLYHLFITKNLTFMDYFHHIVFVGIGCAPGFLIYNNNLVRLSSFAACGLTGTIEYFTLALVKHKKLNSLTQKNISSYLYNYVRYPLSIYSILAIYIVYINNPLIVTNTWLLMYVTFIIFLNGSFYNKLTIENYIIHKMIERNKINNNINLDKQYN
jgi:hypothetical protein